ncbi:lytic transglycosylase domain-containing protein [Bradyrhizobium sp. AZCC 2289]|uniref:lytic transglycosylase domain-containing protein n=1 Tax=Bradyrhizobium sp. AZCC 2289 TaxID=3117026 RepID=UPI002FF0530A
MSTLAEKVVIPLFDRTQHHSSVPTTFATAVARNGGPGRPRGRRKCTLPWTAVSTMAGSRLLRLAACLSGVLLTIVSLSDAMADAESTAPGSRSSRAFRVESLATFITEASRRFAIPEHWIRAVMQLESGGDERAISPMGALGPMQIMPRTWVELSVRYGLGIDPFDPRDNIMAGAAYLREMHDRFGSPGFLAAYNAGPERYEQHLATGRPLPAETQAYVAALAPILKPELRDGRVSVANPVVLWRHAPLFVGHIESVPVAGRSASTLPLKSSSDVLSGASPSRLTPHAEGLFVRRSNEMRSR